MNHAHLSDKSPRRLVEKRSSDTTHCRHGSESGQATTEFALILFPLLLLVAGIIQFGIALNYWLDMQRIANQGARWAAVNNWPPDCPRLSAPGTCGNWPSTKPKTLQQHLIDQAITNGLKLDLEDPNAVQVCYPSGVKAEGYPVRVRLQAPFDLLPILGVGSLTLRANATMRLEQNPTLITGASLSCP